MLQRNMAGDVLAEALTGHLYPEELQARLRPFGIGEQVAVLAFSLADPSRRGRAAGTDSRARAGAAASWRSARAAVRRDRRRRRRPDRAGAHGPRRSWPARFGEVRAAASRAAPTHSLRLSFHEARCALEAVRLRNGDAPEVASYADLGAFQLLLSLQDDDALISYCRGVLGPVEQGEGEYGEELLRSLDVFIEHNGHWEKAASALYCHRHTLRYRIRRVEQLTGRDFSHARDRIEFWLALRGRELATMRIGVPTEIKIGRVPRRDHPGGGAGAERARARGARAGGRRRGQRDGRRAVPRAGRADRAPTRRRVFAEAELVLKVKEPQAVEVGMLREGQTLFTYLHLAAEPELARGLQDSGATCIAYETVEDADGRLPLLAPMSEVAGKIATQAGAFMLEKPLGGRGHPARRGAGRGGRDGARDRRRRGGDERGVHRDRDAGRRVRVRPLDRPAARAGSRVRRARLDGVLLDARDRGDAAARRPGDRRRARPRRARAARGHARAAEADARHAVLVDVSIDQGGCFETSRPTTHSDPTFEVDGITHYCVTNMPGAVPITSTYALTNATLPYVIELAEHGVERGARAQTRPAPRPERAARRDHPPGGRRGAGRPGAGRFSDARRSSHEVDTTSVTRPPDPQEEFDMATQVDVLSNFIDGELAGLATARPKRSSTRPPARSWRARP